MAAAGTWKLSSTWAWRQLWLTSYQLLPGRLVAPVALGLPLVELVCGIAVLLGAFGSGPLVAAAALYGLFALAVAGAKSIGLEVPCGCIPWLEGLISWRVAVRNTVVLVALVVVARRGLSAPSVDGLDRPAQAAITVGSVGVVLVTIELVRAWHRRRLIAALLVQAATGPTSLAVNERT